MQRALHPFIFGILATCGASAGAQWNLPAPSALAEADRHYVWSTYYYVHTAKAVQGPGSVALRNRAGQALGASLSARDFCYAAMEGTVRVDLGDRSELFNAGGLGTTRAADCTPFFSRSNARFAIGKQRFLKVGSGSPWGLGIAGYRLVPFRTIATDRAFIRSGTALFVSRLRGMRFTDANNSSFTHDGYVFAADVGGSIKRCHIDFFAGAIADGSLFPFASGKDRPRSLEVYTVRDQSIVARLHSEHALRPGPTPIPEVRNCLASRIGPQQD